VRAAKERIMAVLDTRVKNKSPLLYQDVLFWIVLKSLPKRLHDVYTLNLSMFSFVVQQSNRVTLKMEVSYTDHSHIIGRGGNTISRVMEDTHCHVHFPDSNRTNQTEKSNLVTVAGELAGVEKARARVRVILLFTQILIHV